MEILKNYLTSQEIKTIGEMAVSQDNYMDVEWVKMTTVADFCTDYKLKRNDDGSTTWSEEEYNKLLQDGSINKLYDNIINIDVLNRYIEDARKYAIFGYIAEQLNSSIKGIDNNKLVEDFSKAVTELKEVDA